MARTYTTMPWIEIGNGALASVTFLLAHFGAGFSLLTATVLGGAAYVCYRIAFGTDATLEDLYSDVEGFDASSAAKALESARSALLRARLAMGEIEGSSQAPLLSEVIGAADRIMAQVEQDPKRLSAAQRFLEIYLDGIANAAEKYAHLRGRGESDGIRTQFQDLLTDAKLVCERQERAMVQDDENDLDLDITVLRRRMALAKQTNS
jgi:5-bromo-4-chloroindolyl phosphate hydrolysis protein